MPMKRNENTKTWQWLRSLPVASWGDAFHRLRGCPVSAASIRHALKHLPAWRLTLRHGDGRPTMILRGGTQEDAMRAAEWYFAQRDVERRVVSVEPL